MFLNLYPENNFKGPSNKGSIGSNQANQAKKGNDKLGDLFYRTNSSINNPQDIFSMGVTGVTGVGPTGSINSGTVDKSKEKDDGKTFLKKKK